MKKLLKDFSSYHLRFHFMNEIYFWKFMNETFSGCLNISIKNLHRNDSFSYNGCLTFYLIWLTLQELVIENLLRDPIKASFAWRTSPKKEIDSRTNCALNSIEKSRVSFYENSAPWIFCHRTPWHFDSVPLDLFDTSIVQVFVFPVGLDGSAWILLIHGAWLMTLKL